MSASDLAIPKRWTFLLFFYAGGFFLSLSALFVCWSKLETTRGEVTSLVIKRTLLEEELQTLQALRDGTEQANVALREQVDTLRGVSSSDIGSAPAVTPAVLPPRPTLTPEQQRMVDAGRQFVLGRSDDHVKPRTPAEEAALQERIRVRRVMRARLDVTRRQHAATYQEGLQSRADFFNAIPEEGLPVELLQEKEAVVSGLEELKQIHAALTEGGQDPAERRRLSRRKDEIKKQLPEMMNRQRRILLADLATEDLGLTEEETLRFLEYMQQLDSMAQERL